LQGETMKGSEGSLLPSGRRRLTLIQEEVLTMIVVGQRLARHGCGLPPSVRDMTGWMGWRSSRTASMVLDALERKGYIRRLGLARGIEVIR
jgi:SOS-response transcriptional repressor LexA